MSSLYATFDRFPSTKGAGTHIARMATTLFEEIDGGVLYVLGGEDLPPYQCEGNVEVVRYASGETSFLDRALGFGRRLELLLEKHAERLELCHFRDPWSGVPIVSRRERRYRTVYEVNGLPSIELPYTFPSLSRSTLAKIRNAEAFCWSGADAIITPSETIAANLVRLGADATKISVIPNGADVPPPRPNAHPDAPARYIIYIGALQSWQGVDLLLRAFAKLAPRHDIDLVVCSSVHPRRAKIYRKLAERLGIEGRVQWRYMLGKSELSSWLAGATLSIAPLTECSRNIEQGCAPLKILESMALGVPVLASDLPAVREIITDCADGFLVRPDRPAELARAIELLLEEPHLLRDVGERGRLRVERDLTWDHATARLRRLYRDLMTDRAAEDHILAAEDRIR